MSAQDWNSLLDSTEDDSSGLYVRTNEFQDVCISFKQLANSLFMVSAETGYWKWAIISAHAALQGACVCILTGTDGLGALEKETQKRTWDKLYGEKNGKRRIDDKSELWPEPRIASLTDLLKKLPGDLAITLPGRNSKSYPWNSAGDLRRLHEWRNQFTHFSPRSWSIEIAGLPRVVRETVGLTERIVESPHYQRINQFRDLGLEEVFFEIRATLKKNWIPR